MSRIVGGTTRINAERAVHYPGEIRLAGRGETVACGGRWIAEPRVMVEYDVDGFGHRAAGPYSPEEAEAQRRDIVGYDGVAASAKLTTLRPDQCLHAWSGKTGGEHTCLRPGCRATRRIADGALESYSSGERPRLPKTAAEAIDILGKTLTAALRVAGATAFDDDDADAEEVLS